MAASDTRGYSLLVLPATAYLALVFVVPLAMLVAGSLMLDGSPTLQSYARYLGDEHNRATVWTTIRYASYSSLACLLLGYPFARLMARTAGTAQALLFAALLLPLSLSLMVRAFGWTLLLGREGPTLRVRGVDMLEGTPILDIKPYLSGVPPERLRRGWLAEAEARSAEKP